ncbi:MAG: Fur family transcriptional regulator [Roseiflexaceae bacterium]
MTTSDQRLSLMLARLEESGRRLTPQRVAVCEALLTHGGHPTPMEVRDLVWTHHPSISQATVYNTITVLEELGLINKLDIAHDEHTHYDVVVQPHVNVVCTRCDRITDVHTDTLEALLGLVATRSGYLIARGGIILYGLCAECKAQG